MTHTHTQELHEYLQYQAYLASPRENTDLAAYIAAPTVNKLTVTLTVAALRQAATLKVQEGIDLEKVSQRFR